MDKSGPSTPDGAGSWHRFRIEKPRPANTPTARRPSAPGSGSKASPRIKTDYNSMEGVEGGEDSQSGGGGQGEDGAPTSAGGTPSVAAPGSNGTVAMYACIRCRNSKKKCDRILPECTACKRLGARCFFPSPVASTASQAAALRARVTWLSNFVDSLMPVGSAPVSCYDTGFDLHSLPHLARLTEGAAARGSIPATPTGPAPAAGAAPAAPVPVAVPVSGPGPTMVPQHPAEDHDMDGVPPGQTSAGSIHQQPTPSSIDNPEPPPMHHHQGLPPATMPQMPPASRTPRYNPSDALSVRPRLPPVRSYTARFSHMHLVRAYFRHMHRSYPFLYESTIIDAAESHIGHAVFEEGHSIDLTSVRLYLVMVVGLEAISRFGGTRSGGETFRNGMAGLGHRTSASVDIDEDDRTVAAEALAQVRMPYQEIVQTCLSNRSIPAVEVLLLLTLYALFDPDGWSPWVIVGMLGRESVLLGLNRRGSADSEPSQMLKREFRHRLFWCIFSIDRLVASVYGLSLAVQDYDSNLSLPGVTTEEFAASEQAEHITTLQIARQAIALRDIEGRCLSLVHLGHGGLSLSHPAGPFHQQQQQHRMLLPSIRERRAMIDELRGAADNWYTQGTLLARREAHAVHFHNTITWLNTNYHGMLMLLYCPSLFNSGPSEPEDLLDLHRTIGKYVQSVHAQFVDRQLALNWTTVSRMLLVCRILLHTYFNLCCETPASGSNGGYGGGYNTAGTPGSSSLAPPAAPEQQLATIVAEQLDMILQCESILHAFQHTWVYARRGSHLYRRLESAFRLRLRQIQSRDAALATSSSVAAAVAANPEMPPYYFHNSPSDRGHHGYGSQGQGQNQGYGHSGGHGHSHHHANTLHDYHSQSHHYGQGQGQGHNHASIASNSPASPYGGGGGGGLPAPSSAAAAAVRNEEIDITNDIHDICDEVEELIQKSLGVASTYNYLSGERRTRPRRTTVQAPAPTHHGHHVHGHA
ncbi:Rac GTPase-activating protein BCR/ABR [Sporothrix stenoceras]|uniref:Rac GTPase-activating protein BCR/ABR n=1 Tax=Sporothrix stenoceras TaxID=5173 RepID=A0ABR3YW80_9PEZI